MAFFNEEGLSASELELRLQDLLAMSKLDEESEAMNLFEEGRHLVASDALPWGDEVRSAVVNAYVRFIHGEMWATGDGARVMESEIAAMMGEMLGNTGVQARITTGGSESVLSALACAKYRAFLRRYPGASPTEGFASAVGGVEPNRQYLEFEREPKSVVMPLHQHFSTFKGCALLGLEPIVVRPRAGRFWHVEPDDLRAAVRDDTIAVFATAGVWPYGTVDPIEEYGSIAEDHDLYFHVDACFGGFVIPFLERAAYYRPPLRPWDFRVPSVCSISADLHKNGMVPPPCGLLLFRGARDLEMAKVICPPSGLLTGTRATGPVAAAWTMLRAAGVEGFTQISLLTIGLRDALIDGCEVIPGLKTTRESQANLFAVYSDELDLRPAVEALRARGWTLATEPVPPPVCIVLIPMPQNRGRVEPFLRDLRDAVERCAVPLGSAPLDYEYSHYGGIPF